MKEEYSKRKKIDLPMRRLWIIILGCLSSFEVFTQSGVLPFVNYTVEDGLPSMHVYDIIQDSKGYIWFGTDKGVSRFDGYQFQNYTTKDGLSNNDVFRLIEDRKGRIWFSSIQRLSYFENGEIHQMPNDSSGVFNYVLSIKETKDGFWLSRTHTVFRLDDSLKYRKHPLFINRKNGKLNPARLLFSNKDTTWIYASNVLYAMEGDKLIDSLQVPSPVNKHTSVAVGQIKNNIYLTTAQGLIEWNRSNNKITTIHPEITHAERIFSTDKNLWVTYHGLGIKRIDLDNGSENPEEFEYLGEVFCSGFMEDREGNYWISSLGKGVYFVPANAEKIKHFSIDDGLFDNLVTSVFMDDNQDIWLGYHSNKMERLDQRNRITRFDFPVKNPNSLHRVLDIDITPINKDLLAVTDGGLFRKEGNKFEKIIQQVTKSISVGKNDEVLVTSAKGTFLFPSEYLDSLDNYNPMKFPNESKVSILSTERSYAGYCDSKNWAWLGDVTGFKTVLPDSTTIHWTQKSEIFNGLITDIIETDDGLIWASTDGEGIIIFKDSSFFQIGSSDGLASDICTSLAWDDSGVWVGTNRGFSYVHSFDYEKKEVGISNFGLSEGLLTNDVKDIFKKGDTIIIGTNKGISIFNEKEISENHYPPDIYIKNIKINDRDTSLSNFFDLDYNQNHIQIDFVGLSFRSMNNIIYRYKMEGLQDDWKSTKILRANYTTLPAGDYTFQVKAVINGSLESEVKKIHFHINQHFTRQAWFIILCSILGAALMFYFYYSFNIWLQRKNLQKVIENQTAELNQRLTELIKTNDKLENANTALKQFAYVVSHDLKAPLRGISTLAAFLEEDMQDRMKTDEKENMSLLKGRVKRMEALINGILEYSRVGRTNVKEEPVLIKNLIPETLQTIENTTKKKIQISLPDNLPTINANLTSLRQVFQNLLSNAVKYNDKEICEIDLLYKKREQDHLFGIKDNGPGIPKRFHNKVFYIFQTLQPRDEVESTGIGLAIVQKIVKELGRGEVWLESEESEGTTFYFTWTK